MESELALPMGYWKGSGLAILIDLLVSILSGGQTTNEIGKNEDEYGLSQLFIAFDLEQLTDGDSRASVIREVTGSLLDTTAMDDGGEVFYPGQQSWLRRLDNQQKGIPVDRDLWALIRNEAG